MMYYVRRSLSGRGTDTEEKKDDTLNIFSVASGHLYERFLRYIIVYLYYSEIHLIGMTYMESRIFYCL